jgi:hypothetical protein
MPNKNKGPKEKKMVWLRREEKEHMHGDSVCRKFENL